jgi:hypothetical protein
MQFSHKIPLYDWLWIYFWLPSAENLPKKRKKNAPLIKTRK